MSTAASKRTINWFKSTRSSERATCVEVRFDADTILIRDSKQNDEYAAASDQQPMIACPAVQWSPFLDLALSAQPGRVDPLAINIRPDGHADLTGPNSSGETVRLQYRPDEWEAFTKGVANGEFNLR